MAATAKNASQPPRKRQATASGSTALEPEALPTADELYAAVERYAMARHLANIANEETFAAGRELRAILGRLGVDRYAVSGGQ